MESGPGPQILYLTIAPQNPAVWILGWRGGFLWHQASVKACQSLSSISSRDSSSARDTFLEPWKLKRVFIKCERLCASHVQRRDGDLTVEISLPLWAGKFVQLFSMGGINNFWNWFVSSLLHLRVLAHISWVQSNFDSNSSLPPAQKACPRNLSSFL